MPNAAKLTHWFDWDPVKARRNLTDRGVSFRIASTLFRDPLAITIYEVEHSEFEERWATLGQAANGQILVVIHTFNQTAASDVTIRIITARQATRREVKNYQDMPR